MFVKPRRILELLLAYSSNPEVDIRQSFLVGLAKKVVPAELLVSKVVEALPLEEKVKEDILQSIVRHCNENNIDLVDLALDQKQLQLLIALCDLSDQMIGIIKDNK